MDKNELTRQLMSTYLEELHEHVESMNRELLALEKEPPPDERAKSLMLLFRAAHSLKGASRAVNVKLVEDACHKLEDILDSARDNAAAMPPSAFSLFYQAVDGIQEVGTRLRSEQPLDDAALRSLLPQLGATSVDGDFAQPPVAPSAAAAPGPSPEPMKEATIRLNADKLDELLGQTGELLVARRRVELRKGDAVSLREAMSDFRDTWRETVERPLRELMGRLGDSPPASDALENANKILVNMERRLDRLATDIAVDFRTLDHTSKDLDDEVHRIRMLPFEEACRGLERAVRDLAIAEDKQVELTIHGGDVEVDRSVLESLKDPLMHIVRNAVDHGIESTEQRRAAGKSIQARVEISAELRGGQVQVTVSDDGGGLDLNRIRQRAESLGMAVPEDQRELSRLIFAHGFSTAATVSDLSGRGVGLDVVFSQIELLRGHVDVASTPGEGTEFILAVPLTLTTMHCLLVEVNDQTFALPTQNVQQLVRLSSDAVRRLGGRPCLLVDDQPIALATLRETLWSDGEQKKASEIEEDKLLACLVQVAEQQVAFIVDRVTNEQEVLIKNLGRRVRRSRHISGATILPSGEVALVLNVPNLVRSAVSDGPVSRASRQYVGVEQQRPRRRLMVVEDSITTRTLMKSILESAGYDVVTSADGQSGWEQLQLAAVDLVVSDVDMPRMDGFQLTEAIRRSPQLGEIPVVLLTSRATERDRERGAEVGADAFLVKTGFDQTNLLEQIDALL